MVCLLVLNSVQQFLRRFIGGGSGDEFVGDELGAEVALAEFFFVQVDHADWRKA